jgi:hypothetical protein
MDPGGGLGRQVWGRTCLPGRYEFFQLRTCALRCAFSRRATVSTLVVASYHGVRLDIASPSVRPSHLSSCSVGPAAEVGTCMASQKIDHTIAGKKEFAFLRYSWHIVLSVDT